MPASVKVEGVARLQSTMGAAGRDLADPGAAQRSAAEIITRRAQSTAPRRTGRLARSIRASVRRAEAAASTTVPYGWPVHSGVPSHNIRPDPFLTRAVEDTRPQWEAAYTADVDKTMRQVKGA